MMRYLLDTNILSDLIKNPQGFAAKQVLTINKNKIVTSIIVAAEMRYGVEKKNSPVLTERVHLLLQTIEVMPLDGEVDKHYGRIRLQLERQGAMIGANDLFIAAHAMAIGAVLVTHTTREFERIEGLKIENWIK
ncbi:MAG: type II toxin-antitoxin system VapC family toxin [Gammaproteobacteria bacterium]|nr:type II toxin-antitoxin system VapC family toxin [Gammaproteobacteria bacterium]